MNGSGTENTASSFDAFLKWVADDRLETIRGDALLMEAMRRIHAADEAGCGLTVREIVDPLPMARRTLERRFQQTLGTTIHQTLARCRLRRAQRLLAETRLPITEVAVQAGYSDLSQMAKSFQREFGRTPGQYRERSR